MRLRSNRISAEIGLALSLVVLICAFRIDTGQPETSEPPISTPVDLHDVYVIDIPPTTYKVRSNAPRVNSLLPPEEVPDNPQGPTDIIKDVMPEIPSDPESGDYPVIPDLPEPPSDPVPDPVYDEGQVIDFAEVAPQPIGGIAGIQAAIDYPDFARRVGTEGRVFVQFIVEPDGSVSNAVVTRGIGSGCDEAALDAITNARFTPGFQNGRAVRVRMSLPVTFRLN